TAGRPPPLAAPPQTTPATPSTSPPPKESMQRRAGKGIKPSLLALRAVSRSPDRPSHSVCVRCCVRAPRRFPSGRHSRHDLGHGFGVVSSGRTLGISSVVLRVQALSLVRSLDGGARRIRSLTRAYQHDPEAGRRSTFGIESRWPKIMNYCTYFLPF